MRRFIQSALALYMISALPGGAAQFYSESFTTGSNGWKGTCDYVSGSWNFTGGAARVNFNDTGFVPVPDVAVLSNAPSASSGSFTGNFDVAGVENIGFKFMAPVELPSDVRIELGGVTSVYQRSFISQITQTGVWYSLSASVLSREGGGWTNVLGPVGDFVSVRQNVKYVTIKINRAASTAARQYVVDDLNLFGSPEVAGWSSSTGGLLSLQVNYLATGRTYEVYAAPAVTGTWTWSQNIVPTGSSQWVTITNTTATNQFFRLWLP